MRLVRIALGLATLLVSANAARTTEAADLTFIVDQQVGQATGDTCQSYVLAIALAFKRDPTIPLASWRDLRDIELRLRAEVVKARDARLPGVPPAKRLAIPADSAKAMEAVTGGAYTVAYKTIAEPDLGEFVRSTTGVGFKADAGLSFVLGSTVKDVVISSAKMIGTKAYNSGHQFSILGVDGPPNSGRQYLVLNSAAYRVKDKQSFNSCQAGLPDDAGPYFPSLSWHNDVTFNLDGGRVRVLTVVHR